MKRFALLALMVLLATPSVSHAAPTDRVPSNDPAWHSTDVIQKSGFIMGSPEGTVTGRRVLTRQDFAGAVAKLMREVGGSPAIANQLAASPSALVALKSLVVEFTPELTAVKENVAAYQSTLAALAARHPLVDHPFSDVPPGHWAADAVETLRQRGIVNGYPAGTYRTK